MEDLFPKQTLWESQRVKFYEYGHKYLLDGKTELIGVTTLMKKHGLSPDYSGIAPDVLAHAAALGTAAHKRIEDYCEGRPTPDCRLIKTFRKLGLNVVRCEYLVTDEQTTASSVDLLAQKEEGVFILIDMKRTSTVHRDALAWQLGIYRYLFLQDNPWAKVDKCYCLPIKKGNKDDIEADTCGALVEIEPVSEEKVKALLEAERNGDTYKDDQTDQQPGIVSYTDMLTLADSSAKIKEMKATLEELESVYKAVADRVYETMLSANVDTIDTGSCIISLKRPYTKRALDSKRLQAELPDVADKYMKETEVKGNISIKLK